MQATVRQYAESRRILAIDPGPERSAWLLLEHVETEQPSVFGIDDNEKVRAFLRMAGARGVAFSLVVIEQIASGRRSAEAVDPQRRCPIWRLQGRVAGPRARLHLRGRCPVPGLRLSVGCEETRT